MGEDKTLMPFANYATLAEFQYMRFQNKFKNIYISAKNDKFDFKCDLILDESNIFAPTVAIFKILEFLQEDVFIISIDTPFIDDQILNEIIHKHTDQKIATIAKEDGKIHPLCGIYSKKLLPILGDFVKRDFHKLTAILDREDVEFVEFKKSELFFNINKQEDYQKAKNILGEKIE